MTQGPKTQMQGQNHLGHLALTSWGHCCGQDHDHGLYHATIFMEGDAERIQDNSPETKMGLDKVRRTLLIKTLVLSSYQAELHKLMHCGKTEARAVLGCGAGNSKLFTGSALVF